MAQRLPSMQALRAFDAAARLKSLTRAAEALHLTHGAVSHQIKQLEDELGVALVARAGRGIALTDEGERFAARVRDALEQIGDAMREMHDRSNPRQLKVSVMPSFAARWLLPRVGRFLRIHPEIDLDVRASTALADFRRDDVDAGVRYGSGQYSGVVTELLMGDSFFPVASPKLIGGRPLVPADLKRFTLLRSDNETWKPWFEAAGLDWPEPSRGAMYDDASHVMQAAIEGQGVALARSSLIGNDLANGLLCRPFDMAVPSPHRYYFVYPPRLAESAKLVAFREWLKDEIRASGDASQQVLGAKRKPLPRRRARDGQ